jgi:hypothetical protein
LVINNGCCWDHVEAVRNLEINRTIDLDPSRGLPHCWNLAVLYAKHDWVVIANDDVIFEGGWHQAMESAANDGYRCMTLAYPKNRWGCFAVHKSLIAEIGWFDEAFTGIYFEDEDWWLRLQEAGEKCALLDAVKHDSKLRCEDRKHHGTVLDLDPKANEAAFRSKWEATGDNTGFKTKGTFDGAINCRVRRTRDEVNWHPYATLLWSEYRD